MINSVISLEWLDNYKASHSGGRQYDIQISCTIVTTL